MIRAALRAVEVNASEDQILWFKGRLVAAWASIAEGPQEELAKTIT